jgi:hypothetical protein
VRARRSGRRRFIGAGLAVLIAAAVAGVVPASTAHADEQTISVDNLRTGWDANEPGLTPQAASVKGNINELFNTQLEGQIYAQPLVIDASGSTPATVVVATESDKVYGVDPQTGQVLWKKGLGTPWPSATVDCGNITTQIGVTSTPVYDPATHAVYVMAKSSGKTSSGATDPLNPHWKLHALNVATGSELPGWPVKISGYPDNDPVHAFDSLTVAQRPGLLLLDGVVYAGFASYCDAGPFDGYVAGVSTTTHAMTSLWTTTAGTDNGWAGIWQSGGGLMSDGSGRIFVATGNGNGDAPPPGPGSSPPAALSESVIRLGVNSKGKISAKDFFSPTNNASLNADDLDLGSGGPLAIPGKVDGLKLLVQVGKDGRVFLLNRDDLGGMGQGPGGTDDAVDIAGPFNGVWGHPAYWGGPGNVAASGGYVYDVENQGPLRAFHLSTTAAGQPALTPVATSTGTFGYTSGSPVITSAGSDAGSALVWVVYAATEYGTGGDLRAYDAEPDNGTLDQVYSSADQGLSFAQEKFTTPATDGNRIYFGTLDGHIMGFGEQSQPAVAAPPTPFPAESVGSSTPPQTVTMTAARSATIESISAQGPFAVTSAPSLPMDVDTGDSLSASVTFSPTQPGLADGSLVVTTEDGRTDYLDLSGYGSQTGLVPSASSLDFGTVPTGASKQVSVDIVNTGSAAEFVSASLMDQGDPGDPFAIVGADPSGVTVQPEQSLAIPIAYTPVSVSPSDTDTLSIQGKDESGNDNASTSVSLTAASITGQASLDLHPNPLKFHKIDVGTTLTKTFKVRNTGNIPLQLSKAAPPAGEFQTTSPVAEGTTLQPGQAIKQSMTFTPTTGGHATATYYFNFTDQTGAPHDPQIETFKGGGIDEIAKFYKSLGGKHSSLGKPEGPEFATGVGRERDYNNGRIYWSAATGAHDLHGPVLTHYLALGGPTGFAGFPTSNVHYASDGVGRDAHFAFHTAIYHHHHVGTYEVNGAIKHRWTGLGGVESRLGYPTSDEYSASSNVRRSNFQHGHITWHSKSGKTDVTYTKHHHKKKKKHKKTHKHGHHHHVTE